METDALVFALLFTLANLYEYFDGFLYYNDLEIEHALTMNAFEKRLDTGGLIIN